MIGIVIGCSTLHNYERWLKDNQLDYVLIDSTTDISEIDVMIFCGGPDLGENHERDEREHIVFQKCKKQGIAVWGGCRGMQVVSYWLGATLIPDLGEKNITHKTLTNEQSRWHDILLSDGKVWKVNSRHHQAVGQPPFQCTLSALSTDGVIELLQSTDNKYLLVQSHPEMTEMTGSEIERYCIAWIEMHTSSH